MKDREFLDGKMLFKNILGRPEQLLSIKRDGCAMVRMRVGSLHHTASWLCCPSCNSNKIWRFSLASMYSHRQMYTNTHTHSVCLCAHNTQIHMCTQRGNILILCEFHNYGQHILCIFFPLPNSSQIHLSSPPHFVTFLKIHQVKLVLHIFVGIGP